MYSLSPARIRSAAAWRLLQPGTTRSAAAIRSAVVRLSDDALSILDEELEFFVETGFVGRVMSTLLSELPLQSPLAA